MELVPVNSEDERAGFSSGFSLESLGSFLESQRDLFHSQVEQLQRIVLTQCKVTGVNPLSQEMAAGTLSIKIGKRPRDLLNPKAVSYMQSIFSIKDMIGKKETREISSYCGATLTQVREFFAGQRSRVRKFIRVSREKAAWTVSKTSENECSINPSHAISGDAPVPIHSAYSNTVEICPNPALDTSKASDCPHENRTHLDAMKLENSGDGTSCSLDNKISPNDDKFLENIFKLMKKEEKFSGQMKLMEWIMQINNPAILYWFLSKGGMTILAEWLCQAVAEEQTTIILFIFKVLCHLPLHKALPLHMSSVLQTVNKLRFYRKSDISNKARFLLSRWSKLFVKGHTKKSLMHTIDQEGDYPLQLKVVKEENNLLHCEETAINNRQPESKQVLRLLPAPDDNSYGKQKHIISPPKSKVRRKVLLMEHCELTNACKSLSQKTPVASNSRPLSADDIQKAKMRAAFLQNRSAKTDNMNDEKSSQDVIAKAAFDFQARDPSSWHKPFKSTGNDVRKPGSVRTANSAQFSGPLSKSNTPNCTLTFPEKLENFKPWKKPSAIRINSSWEVGCGQNSKEVEAQTVRNKREKEVLYITKGEIPENPKEPWDMEMDFDDSLTPAIPIEQPPDIASEGGDANPVSNDCPISTENVNDNEAQVLPPITLANSANSITEMPDMELLAVLLKNPDLVFALTSGQGSGLTDSERFALLDTLKKHGSGLNGMAGALGGIFVEKQHSNLSFETSPSQTNSDVREPALVSDHSSLQCHPLGSRDISTPSIAGLPSEAATSVCAPENAAVPSSFLGQIPSELLTGFNKSTLQPVGADLFPHSSNSHVSHGMCVTEHVSYHDPVQLPSQSQTVRELCDFKQTPNYNPRNFSGMCSAPPVALNPSGQEWPFVPTPAHVPCDMPMPPTHMRSSLRCDAESLNYVRGREMWSNGHSYMDNHEQAAYLHTNQNGHANFAYDDSVHRVCDVLDSEGWSYGRSHMRRADGARYQSERRDGWKSRFNRYQPGTGHRSYNGRYASR